MMGERRANGADNADQQVPEIEIEALRERLTAGGEQAARVIDVREEWEWAQGHIDGATHIPLGRLPTRLNELAGAPEIYFICRLGGRSEMAARFAHQHGLTGAVNVRGGMDAWESRGYPVTHEG